MTTLGIGSIVDVKATIAPSGRIQRGFGRTLLLTTDTTLDAGAGRVRAFASMDEVARVFAPDSSPYQAAQVYFSQVPYPRNLVIGRWINTRESARLTGGSPSALEEITGRPTVLTGGSPASLDTFHGRATVLTGGSPASLVNFHGRATVLTGTGMVADLVNFHGRATVVTGTGTVADLVNFHGRATVVTGTGMVADLVNFHGRATVLTGTGTVADLVNFHGRATVLTGTGTVADLVNFHGRATVLTGTGTVASLTTLQGITSGTVTFLSQTLTGLDFSAVTDYDGVASVLQTALRATSSTDLDNVEVDYDSASSAFVVTLPLDSSGVATSVSAAFTGDDADELGLDTATIVNGVDAITSGTVTFLSETVTGLDFSDVTDYDGVASVLQTALRATSSTDLDNVEVTYDSAASAFVVTLPLDSTTGVVPTASATFTGDDADELGLDTATIVNGVDAIVSGSVTFLGQTVTGLDFSDVTDYDGVASVLQTALRATSAISLDEVEVVYDGTAFVVTIPLDSSGAATSVSAAFTGDDSDELGLDTATIVDGVSAIQSGSVTFLSQTLTGLDFSDVTDYDDVAAVVQTALRATSETDLDQVEVDYDSTASAFVVTLPLDSSGVVPTASAAFTGTESDELGLDTATIVNGVDAITSGSVTFLSETVTGLDFSDVTDYDGVAAVLQTALRATSATSLDNVEVAYDSTASAFVLTIPLDSSGAATSVSAAFTGDDADEVGLDTATIVNGVDAITSGTVTFLSQTVTGLDFSDVTDYDDVAAVLQTALRATSETDLDQVEVAYDGSAFVVTLPLDSSTGVVPTASAAFTGDDADELGLDTATIVNGVDAIISGTVTFLGQTITGLDFSSVTDYDGVASVLRTDLRATNASGLTNVEVTYDGSAFVVTIPLDSSGVATSVSAAFTGDDADELGLDTATIVNGVDAITSGSVTFLSETVTGLDFSSVEDYDGVASVLQTALRGTSSADLAEVDVAYGGSAFVVTLPLDSTGEATSVSAAFTGSESDELGLDTVDTTPGIDGIGAGSLSWQGSTITGLDFTDATSYADVAQTLQTALRAVRAAARADLRSAAVTYHPAGFFLVELGFDPSDDEPYPITGYMADVAQGVASDLSLDSDSGGIITQGHATETIEEGMSAIGAQDDSWYFVALDSGITVAIDLLALSRWVQEANNYMLALDVAGDSVLVQGESTSLAAQIAVLEPERTFLVWSRTSDHKALSLAGRLSTVNFDGQNTLITAKFKSLPGTVPDVLTTAQKEELDRKRVGYYTRFGPDAIFAEGHTLKPGVWIDSRYWLDWITNAIQTEVYNLLRQHPTRVPQTDSGIASITATIERVCEAGRRNGGIAPGRVSEALAHDIRLATGNRDFDGALTLGYLVSVGSIADQLQANRDARMAPRISVWLKASGAVHSAEVRLIFTN